MPSVRKSTGRAVTPVRQPEVAAAKNTQLPAPALVAFPLPTTLVLRPETGPASPTARLSPPEIVTPPLARLEPPGAALSVARIPPIEAGTSVPIEFADLSIASLRWPPEAPDSPGPAALRPILSPAVFDQEAESGAFPWPPRTDQLETAGRLIEGGDWLLNHDPGLGQEIIACLALRELFRSRRARRALVTTPASGLRSWRRWLTEWGPAVPLFHDAAAPLEPESPGIWLLGHADALDLSADLGPIEVLVLDSYAALRRRGGDPTRLNGFSPERRWVLSGGPPAEAEDWRLLNRFFRPNWGGTSSLADIHDRFRDHTLAQTRMKLADALPRRSRQELWFDLGPEQRQAYQSVLDHERSRLARLGGAVNRTHIEGALTRLKQALAFLPDSLDGVKVRALVDLTEEILASGAKLLVAAPPEPALLEGLMAVLEAHGAARLDSQASPEEQARALAAFRLPSGPRLLVVDTDARSDGEPLLGASYLIHFSHEWNPAHRRRAEQRLFPDLGPSEPHTVFEFWVADSVEETYHALLEAQGLLAGDVGHATRPSELEERLAIGDWLAKVFEVNGETGRASKPSTGRLPGTGDLRAAWSQLDDESLAEAAESVIRAFGLTGSRRLTEPGPTGCDFLADATTAAGAAQVFVRCLRAEAPVGEGAAQDVLATLDQRGDCTGAYLVATAEFTEPCRRLAQTDGGRLALVDGAEFHRHLKVLGLMR